MMIIDPRELEIIIIIANEIIIIIIIQCDYNNNNNKSELFEIIDLLIKYPTRQIKE